MAKTKVQITIDEGLLSRIDQYADEYYMNRSSVLTLSATQFINAAEVTTAIKGMAVSMRKIADSGEVDSDTMRQLEDFERLAALMYGKA